MCVPAYAEPLWLARAAGLAGAVATMLWTGAVHPPGGALVLIFADSLKVLRQHDALRRRRRCAAAARMG